MVITKEAYAKLSKDERLRLRICDLYDLPMTTSKQDINIYIRKLNEDKLRDYKSRV